MGRADIQVGSPSIEKRDPVPAVFNQGAKSLLAQTGFIRPAFAAGRVVFRWIGGSFQLLPPGYRPGGNRGRLLFSHLKPCLSCKKKSLYRRQTKRLRRALQSDLADRR